MTLGLSSLIYVFAASGLPVVFPIRLLQSVDHQLVVNTKEAKCTMPGQLSSNAPLAPVDPNTVFLPRAPRQAANEAVRARQASLL